jgi:hypothetical protein
MERASEKIVFYTAAAFLAISKSSPTFGDPRTVGGKRVERLLTNWIIPILVF